MKKPIYTNKAPQPIGPYSQAIAVGNILYLSGMIPLDEVTLQIVEGDVAVQTAKVMEHIGHILNAWGLDYGDLVKTTVYLTDMEDFPMVNQVYGRYLPEPYPARSCVQVVRLPRDVRVEIEAIAVKKMEE
jgi:2-iminobutanoate/2-iminopropanoate deaminase